MKRVNWMGVPKVFIIDDSVTDCVLMTKALQHAGYEVGIATDGREGLTTILADLPQCLILDIVLPGINGYTICRQVRTRDPHHTLPIIIVSTKSSAIDQKYALSLGADQYLPKPFTAEMLVQTVWEVLPESVRAVAAQAGRHTVPNNTFERHMQSDVRTMGPYRRNEAETMWLSSPFAGSPVISDRQARRLYADIDGHKTVEDLSGLMQLDLTATLSLLKTHWEQQRIAFFDSEGRPLEHIPFLVLD